MTATIFYRHDGLNALTYDQRTVMDGTSCEGDVEFFVELAGRTGGPVLELGAGTGRVSWSIAEAGHELVGIDLSEAMLARAEAKRSKLAPEVAARASFVHGDMSDFDLARKFPLVIVPYRTFQVLLSPEDQRRCLRRIRSHLADDGRVVIDLFDPRLDWCLPDADKPRQLERAKHPATGNEVRVDVVERKNDPLAQVLREKWRFREVDARGEVVAEEIEELAMKWTYRQEMRHLLELEGFAVEAEYSNFQGSPPAYGREQVWVVRSSRVG